MASDEAEDERQRYHEPDFHKPFSPAPYLANTPSYVTCKGLFFQDFVQAVRAARPQVTPEELPQLERRVSAFSDYPLREHMELAVRAAALMYPGVPTREGLRRLGWRMFPSFVDSLVGKVIFTFVSMELDKVFELGPRAFPASLSHGRAESEHVGPQHWRIRFREIYGFLDCYYVGAMEGPIRRANKRPEVRLRMDSLSDGTFDVRWFDS